MFLDNFTCVYKKRIFLNKPIEPGNLIFVQGVYKKIYILDRNDIINSSIFLESWSDLDKLPHTLYTDEIIRYYHYYSDNIVYPYIFDPELANVLEEPVRFVREMNHFCLSHHKWERASLICKLEKGPTDSIYDVCYYIQTKIIDNILAQRREYKSNMFFSLIEKNQLEYLNEKYTQQLNDIYNKYTTTTSDTSKLQITTKQDFSYYNYQLQDIVWMNEIEKCVDTESNVISQTYSQFYPILNDKYMVQNRLLYPTSILNLNECIDTEEHRFYGGNLISEVGLGKTLITYGHILNTKSSEFDKYIEIDNTCNYFYKRGNKRGTSCYQQCEINSLYCQEHRNSIFIDKPKRKLNKEELQNFSFSQIKKTVLGKDYLRTNSTLIICPNQLCDQWVREYYDKLSGLRVITLVSFSQFKNLTLADILFSDVIVVSYQFLTNHNYVKNLCNLHDYNDLRMDFERYKHLEEHEQMERILLQPRTMNLNLFHWKRVVVDEIHEIRNNVKCNLLYNTITQFSSKYRWTISATPFAHGFNGFIDILNFTTTKNTPNFTYSNSKEWSAYALLSYDNLISQTGHLFRKNTKQSVEQEFSGNIIKEHLHLLTFTQQERTMYESYKLRHNDSEIGKNFLIKMCCHVELFNETKSLIQNCKSLDEIQNVISSYHQNERDKYNNMVNVAQTEVVSIQKQIEKTNLEDELAQLKIELGNKKRELTNLTKTLQKITSTCTYLENVINTTLCSDDNSCPICLETISNNQLTIFSCGHTYCWNCIEYLSSNETFKEQSYIKCPHCNTEVDKSHIYKLDVTNKSDITFPNDKPEYFVQETKSTKIGNIIYYLKNRLKSDDKCILFSQWDTLLKKVGSILRENGIGVIGLSGTVYQRKAQIQSFTNDNSIQVLMLSSNNAASGMNLTIANKILFLEPVYGDKEYRKGIENQAIGRADRIGQNKPIDILRFIIKDTVEEEIII